MLDEKYLKPKIKMMDLENNQIELVKTKLILKDSVEMTRIVEYVYVDI